VPLFTRVKPGHPKQTAFPAIAGAVPVGEVTISIEGKAPGHGEHTSMHQTSAQKGSHCIYLLQFGTRVVAKTWGWKDKGQASVLVTHSSFLISVMALFP
jgi:hypothetical protein